MEGFPLEICCVSLLWHFLDLPYNGSVRGSPNGTIGNFTNGTIGSQRYHWLTKVPLGEPMVPLALQLVPMVLPMVPLVEP